MPQNGYSIGRDVSLAVTTSNGPLTINKITGFNTKQETSKQKVKRLDGVTDTLRFFDGWSGSFEVERADSLVEDYFVQLEANYFAGISEIPATILETISNPDGSTSQYRYEHVIMSLDDAGDWKGDASVKIKVSFEASRKKTVV
ncbi:hypothetical protein [Sideroxydans lithotrophicus]|uniref:Phage major tail protein, TP901-1 family n=1 Tax=Sideroxydans lithotrophicus (strain ES-1) TaxID=580332 RepID=D5CT50_SIDLE|nr:hypothetical protein [Sideroxydans lithotrophicus]ADE12136.1 conserved hypothetical protein [Sideroxydans lithotrophicus ES-1]